MDHPGHTEHEQRKRSPRNNVSHYSPHPLVPASGDALAA
jgi:hypothetical protein